MQIQLSFQEYENVAGQDERKPVSDALGPSLEKFTSDFADDYACAEYLAKKRWKSGFPMLSMWRRPRIARSQAVDLEMPGRRRR
uniref:Uncharacterized protein n=1 Tax=Rhizobium leguminosarum TaxID=384 RepID=A0A179BPR4_RHILE|nr:hypothetical protein A4U53_23560 [Rhizobium leguminosarum]